MEKKTELGDTEMLIDFSSPVSKRLLHTPLIPVPTTGNEQCPMPVSPSSTNPFDKVVQQTISQEIIENDPFECASKSTLIKLNTKEKNSSEKQTNFQFDEPCTVINESKNNSKENVSTEREIIANKHNQSCDNRHPVEFQKTNDLIEISVIEKEASMLESKPCVLLSCGSDKVSQVSGDFSTEEGIRNTIAKRINKCIKKALSSSMINTNHSMLNNNRKSSSFTTSASCNKVCNRLNKSCSEQTFTDDSFIVVNHDLKTPESSICSCDITPSFLSKEDLKNNESIIPTSEEDDVFQEANKLARTFSKIAESFSKNAEVENDEDLLSCKPQWLYADSSEDEDEKLKKDPKLNFRASFTNSKSQDQPDSEALSAFKRRSFSQLQSNHSLNESPFKRSLSIGSTITAPVASTVVTTSAPIILGGKDDNHLKLKKKPMGDIRKGPMRAVMPVQNMAKESLIGGVQLQRKCDTSPIRKKNTPQMMISPIKGTSQMSMHPVASSTPNKCNPAIPHIVVPQNKCRSLGSTNENRKSRNPVVESGFRQRSNSANSVIPTAVALHGRGLGPKSISNFSRTPTRVKVNAHEDKDSEKKQAKQIKSNFNPKALNEVKPKIARPNKVKSTVNALSNIFTGKSKKVPLRDKENRFPA